MLLHLFDASLQMYTYREWKINRISPIDKSGDFLLSEYRVTFT